MKIRKILTYILIVVSIWSIIFLVPWSSIINRFKPLPANIQEELDNNGFYQGMIVYVEEDGLGQTYASGFHNREEETPARPDALFKIASITKLYVAVAASKLVDEGVLDLESNLDEMLPDYKGRIENSESITLSHLISHRSGIPNYTDGAFDWSNPPRSNEGCLDLVLDMSAKFEPGKKYGYSNTNYVLLGMIMDAYLEEGYKSYIDESILKPLNLGNTYHLMEEVDQERLMSGYLEDYEYDVKDFDFRSPAGSMIATAEEVGIFLRALNNSTLVTSSEESIYSSVYVYDHTGFLPGYQSIARYDNENDRVIVVFGNTSEGAKWDEIEVLYSRIKRILNK